MKAEFTNNASASGLVRTLREDIRRGDFKRTLRRDWSELHLR